MNSSSHSSIIFLGVNLMLLLSLPLFLYLFFFFLSRPIKNILRTLFWWLSDISKYSSGEENSAGKSKSGIWEGKRETERCVTDLISIPLLLVFSTAYLSNVIFHPFFFVCCICVYACCFLRLLILTTCWLTCVDWLPLCFLVTSSWYFYVILISRELFACRCQYVHLITLFFQLTTPSLILFNSF